MKNALVCGAGGFIGPHLVARLKNEGLRLRGVDLKYPSFGETEADDFVIADLREAQHCCDIIGGRFDEVYQLAAEMGGAGYIFAGRSSNSGPRAAQAAASSPNALWRHRGAAQPDITLLKPAE